MVVSHHGGEGMSFSKEKREQIIFQFLKEIKYHPHRSISAVCQSLGISKQTGYRYMQELKREGVLYKSADSSHYKLRAKNTFRFRIPNIGLDESVVYEENIAPHIKSLSLEGRKKIKYASQEMINNVIEHSEGAFLGIIVQEDAVSVRLIISDDGIGIFKKIAEAFSLPSINDAILELDKGKCTTDPDRHTGEGIFFSSKMFDLFFIQANQLTYVARNSQSRSFLLEDVKGQRSRGTRISMELTKDDASSIDQIFQQYSDGEGFAFNKTVVSVVHLIDRRNTTDMSLVSRSQARRLLYRFDRFASVVLDFAEIESIGQGFADEIFRVYCREHPEVDISFIHANSSIRRMIDHVRNTK